MGVSFLLFPHALLHPVHPDKALKNYQYQIFCRSRIFVALWAATLWPRDSHLTWARLYTEMYEICLILYEAWQDSPLYTFSCRHWVQLLKV